MFNRFFNRLRKPKPTKIDLLKKSGNLVVGHNSDISNLDIIIYGPSDGTLNVVIGDDCLINGKFILYNNRSKISIGDRTYIGGTSLYCYENINIGDDVMFSWDCTVIDTNAHSLLSKERELDVLQWKMGWKHKDWRNVKTKPVLIGNKSWIGFNSIIMKGVTLGEGCVVGAGSVVTESFSDYSIIGGNPAKFIKKTS
ncbi:DapH/DapD/GlmU-related protein [Flavihumibacter sp. ZG627]|uniref:acyltransferase n=1 Tax=Flavihumibacter sp. ZG627 TaxID=1463156 RepID=UPI0006940B57|nr:acyltransferase [Flavihumibacter sp. ZG627]